MNVKTFFIAMLLLLGCAPLYADDSILDIWTRQSELKYQRIQEINRHNDPIYTKLSWIQNRLYTLQSLYNAESFKRYPNQNTLERLSIEAYQLQREAYWLKSQLQPYPSF